MVYFTDAIIIQLIGVVILLFGSVFVFMPETARKHIHRLEKKTNELYKIKGIILIIVGAILLYLGIN